MNKILSNTCLIFKYLVVQYVVWLVLVSHIVELTVIFAHACKNKIKWAIEIILVAVPGKWLLAEIIHIDCWPVSFFNMDQN